MAAAITEMVLPGLGMGMTDGTIAAWHKAPGDWISADEPLCDVEAAKSTVEVFAPREGYLLRIVVPAGSNVPVNTVIAIIGDEAGMAVEEGAAPADGPAQSPPAPPPVPASSPPPAPLTSAPARPGGGPQVEPRARRAARERGLDLALITGSGPGGRIIEEDVLRAAQPIAAGILPAAGAGPAGAVHQLRMRCDTAPLSRMLGGIAEAQGGSISPLAVLVRAVALALAEAGMDNPSVGVRMPDDGLHVIGDAAVLTSRAIDALIAGAAAASTGVPSLVIEPLPDEWLDEIIRIDRAGPPSLCASAFPPGLDGTWRFTLTFGEGAMNLASARRFLGALHGLIGKPLAILV